MIIDYPSRILLLQADSAVRAHWMSLIPTIATTWFHAADIEEARESLRINQPDLVIYQAGDASLAIDSWMAEVSACHSNQLIVLNEHLPAFDYGRLRPGMDVVEAPQVDSLLNLRTKHLLFQKAFKDLTASNLSGFLDPLTGLFNRILFHDVGEKELIRCQRYSRPMSLIIIKVDDLKGINTKFGHKAGDSLIMQLGSVLKQITRQSDVLARIGNKEFGLILSECNLEQCTIRAQQLVETFAKQRPTYEGQILPFSVSLGVAEMDTGDVFLEQLIERTDGSMHPSNVPLSEPVTP